VTDAMSAGDAAYVRELVQRRAAIQLDESKQYLVEMRLEQLARDRGFAGVTQLIAKARASAGGLDTPIVEALTTHETFFFRDQHPFDALRDRVLPALAAARAGSRALTVWSAACSTGQEPYSIAMLLLEHFPALESWPVRVVATDLSERVLERARSGRFSQLEVSRGLPAALLARYFEREGPEWRVRPRLRALVDFRQLNLLDHWSGLRPDVVFLRNVLIYFDVPTKRSILARVHRAIVPDGALFLGTAETTLGLDHRWDRVDCGKTAYYRVRA